MDLRICTEPRQGASDDTLLAAARATEDAGFWAFFRSDHSLEMGDAYGICGTPEERLARLAQWREAGAERVYLQVLDLADLEHIAVVGADVLPRV